MTQPRFKTQSVANWGAFKDALEDYARLSRDARGRFIFRGQSDPDWPLRTSLDRRYANLSFIERERRLRLLLEEFAREILSLDAVRPDLAEVLRRSPSSDWLEGLARHHGLPTTLLDFTQSPYVAAYFAFMGSAAEASTPAAVWMLNRREMVQADNERLLGEVDVVAENRRALEQRGLFLRLPVGTDADIALSGALTRFVIPTADRPTALADLDEMMINAKMLFRDIDGAARTAASRVDLP